MTNSVDAKMLTPFAKQGYNVLLSGKHGVGKTAIIKEVFNKEFGPLNENWKYFSAATMDPFIDFIGIPKNYTRKDGEEVFRIIPPENFTGAEKIEALFFDEINRAPEKTLNAIMELIQFKSINGRKFPHLKCVWAAENPFDDEDHHYMVTELDPAQKDRFNIQLNLPFDLNEKYFLGKYDKDYFNVAKKWWNRNEKPVSPRKLDDMLAGFEKGFNVSLFSNICHTTSELQKNLEGLQFAKKTLVDAVKSGNEKRIRDVMGIDNLRAHSHAINMVNDTETLFDGNVKSVVDEETWAYIERVFTVSNETFTAEDFNNLNILPTRFKLFRDAKKNIKTVKDYEDAIIRLVYGGMTCFKYYDPMPVVNDSWIEDYISPVNYKFYVKANQSFSKETRLAILFLLVQHKISGGSDDVRKPLLYLTGNNPRSGGRTTTPPDFASARLRLIRDYLNGKTNETHETLAPAFNNLIA